MSKIVGLPETMRHQWRPYEAALREILPTFATVEEIEHTVPQLKSIYLRDAVAKAATYSKDTHHEWMAHVISGLLSEAFRREVELHRVRAQNFGSIRPSPHAVVFGEDAFAQIAARQVLDYQRIGWEAFSGSALNALSADYSPAEIEGALLAFHLVFLCYVVRLPPTSTFNQTSGSLWEIAKREIELCRLRALPPSKTNAGPLHLVSSKPTTAT
jgi:hypothetical protein